MQVVEFNVDPERAVPSDSRPLIAHVLYRFDVGGVENGVVNLINHLPESRFRHAVIALTNVTDFRKRVGRDDVSYFALNKQPGQGVRLMPKLSRLFRQLKPALVHTRNLAALEACLPAWWTGVPVRVHGEHGWDISDLDGSHWKHRLTRRGYRPFVSHYIASSQFQERYLDKKIGVRGMRVSQIYNGVDAQRFVPVRLLGQTTRQWPRGCPFANEENAESLFVVGTVGRLQPVKDPLTLVKAFLHIIKHNPQARSSMRLIVVGEGPLLSRMRDMVDQAGMSGLVWFAGVRADIPDLMRAFDVFVQSSLAEGVSNTILEAMSSGLPVIATRVGGSGELVVDNETGFLVPPAKPEAIAKAITVYFDQRLKARVHGDRGRARIEDYFSLERMVSAYATLYERLLARGDMLRDITTIRPPTVHIPLPQHQKKSQPSSKK